MADTLELRIKALIDGQANLEKFVKELSTLQTVASGQIASALDAIAGKMDAVSTSASGGVKSVAGGVLIAEAAMQVFQATVGAVTAAFGNMFAVADKIDAMAGKFDIPAARLAVLSDVARLTDTTLETLGTAMARVTILTAKFGEETNSAADQAFRYLRLDPRTFTDSEDGIRRILGAVGKLSDAQNRSAVLNTLFGRGIGQDLAKAAAEGADGLDILSARSARLGSDIAGGASTAIADLLDRMQDLNKIGANNFTAAFTSALPDIRAVITEVEKLFTFDSNGGSLGVAFRFIAEQTAGIARGLVTIVQLVGDIASPLAAWFKGTAAVVDKTTFIETVLGGMSIAVTRINDEVVLLAAAFIRLAGVIANTVGQSLTFITNQVGSLLGLLGQKLPEGANSAGKAMIKFGEDAKTAAAEFERAGLKGAKTLAVLQRAQAANVIPTSEVDTRGGPAPAAKPPPDGRPAFSVRKKAAVKAEADLAKSQFEIAKAVLEAEYKTTAEVIKAGEAIIAQAYKDGELSIAEVFIARSASLRFKFDAERKLREDELATIDAAIAQAADPVKRNALIKQRVDIDARLQLSEINLAEERRKLEVWRIEQEKQLGNIKVGIDIQLAAAEGRIDISALKAQLDQQFEKQALALKEDPTALARIERIKAATLAQAGLTIAMNATQVAQQQIANQEQFLRTQQERGVLGVFEVEARLRDLRIQQVVALEAQLAALELAASALPPDASGRVAEANAAIDELRLRIEAARPVVVDFASQFSNAFQAGILSPFEAVIRQTDTFANAFKKMLQRIAQDIALSNIKMALTDLFKPDTSGGSGGTFASLISAFLGGKGGSGSVQTSGAFGTGAGYASGGLIGGVGGPTSDSNLAMLSRGEYVMQASAVKSLGAGLLSYINKHGSLPRGFAAGGGLDSNFPTGGGAVNAVTNIQLVNNSRAQLAEPTVERGANGELQIFLRDLRDNGPRAQAMSQSFGLKRSTQ